MDPSDVGAMYRANEVKTQVLSCKIHFILNRDLKDFTVLRGPIIVKISIAHIGKRILCPVGPMIGY